MSKMVTQKWDDKFNWFIYDLFILILTIIDTFKVSWKSDILNIF